MIQQARLAELQKDGPNKTEQMFLTNHFLKNRLTEKMKRIIL
jgi:hypothetical protein